jgi:Uma2 family endonuclease
MAMPASGAHWTVEMLDALPDDGNRYEIMDGELFVTPAPSDVHQLVLGALFSRLRAYMRPGDVGRAIGSPSDVRREDRKRNRVQPDVFVIRLVNGKRPPYPFDLAGVLLVVEVTSPSTANYDSQTKRGLYLDAGVPEYWIVDPEAQTIARWRNTTDPGELLTDAIEWHPAGMSSAFTMELREFLDDALG